MVPPFVAALGVPADFFASYFAGEGRPIRAFCISLGERSSAEVSGRCKPFYKQLLSANSRECPSASFHP
jgi:hypothetical protein